MIGPIARSAGAILVGLAVAMAFMLGAEALSSVLHPYPPGADWNDPEVCRAHVAKYPPWVLLLCDLGWVFGVFVSSWAATRLGSGRHPAHGIAVGLLLFAAIVANMFMLPYPAWLWVLNLAGVPAAIYVGTRLGRGRARSA